MRMFIYSSSIWEWYLYYNPWAYSWGYHDELLGLSTFGEETNCRVGNRDTTWKVLRLSCVQSALGN